MTIPESLLSCLAMFEPCFTAPSYARSLTLMSGWLVCISKRTITGVMRAAGVAGRDASGYQRFFSRAAWSPMKVGEVVLRFVLRLAPSDQRVHLTLDDTLARHTGKRIASAGMHLYSPTTPMLIARLFASCPTRSIWLVADEWMPRCMHHHPPTRESVDLAS